MTIKQNVTRTSLGQSLKSADLMQDLNAVCISTDRSLGRKANDVYKFSKLICPYHGISSDSLPR